MVKNKTALGWIMLFILAVIWGSSFILIKKGLGSYDPLQVGSIRIASAGLVLLPIALRSIGRINRKNIVPLFSVGMVGSLVPAFLFAKAQTRIDSSIAGILNALTPLFVILIGFLFFSQKVNRRTLVGIGLALVGTIVLVSTGQSGAVSFNSYALFIMLATICYGLNVNLIKYRLEGMKALEITSLSLAMTSPFGLVYLFGFSDFADQVLNSGEARIALFYLSLLGILGTAIALVIFNRLVQITNPVFTSSVTYLIPIVALGWGLSDGEALYIGHYIGMVVTLLGVYIANRK